MRLRPLAPSFTLWRCTQIPTTRPPGYPIPGYSTSSPVRSGQAPCWSCIKATPRSIHPPLSLSFFLGPRSRCPAQIVLSALLLHRPPHELDRALDTRSSDDTVPHTTTTARFPFLATSPWLAPIASRPLAISFPTGSEGTQTHHHATDKKSSDREQLLTTTQLLPPIHDLDHLHVLIRISSRLVPARLAISRIIRNASGSSRRRSRALVPFPRLN